LDNAQTRGLPPQRYGSRRVAPCYLRPTRVGNACADIFLLPAEEGALRPARVGTRPCPGLSA